MEPIESYQEPHITKNPDPFEGSQQQAEQTNPSLLLPILRRWYIVLVTFVLICAAAIPAIWYFIKPVHTVTGAIRVAPILTSIVSGERDLGEISDYERFMYTQAVMLTSNQVIQRVADNLTEKNLSFFENYRPDPATRIKQHLKGTRISREPAAILKRAIIDGLIEAAPDRRTELIRVSMNGTNTDEARQIVDAFIRAYMAVEVSESNQDEQDKLTVLRDEQKVLAEKLQRQRDTIQQLAQEYGTTTLGGRQEMMLQRVSSLLSALTELEARRISLEARVELLKHIEEPAIAPEELIQMRDEHINSDASVQYLTKSITELEQGLIVAEQMLTEANPALKQKQQLLDAMKARLEEKRLQAAEEFNKMVADEAGKIDRQKLLSAQAELQQVKAYEQRLRSVLDQQDTDTIELGRKQLKIQDLQDQTGLTKEMYDRIGRRIQELEMERKRPARISVAYNAELASTSDKRIKYTAAVLFAAMAAGAALALLRARTDHYLYTPEDIVKHVGSRIIGTTTRSDGVKTSLLPKQLLGDYQTICANLGLFSTDGVPDKFVVTSPGPREGKTTLAINLATSLVRAGKKVLLIDGDLRKPDIRRLLNLPGHSRGLQELIFGRSFDEVVLHGPLENFDVLTADSRNLADAFKLLSLRRTAECLNDLADRYDHIIIDSPPALAFPDALMWARIAGAVVLTGFAGQTDAPDLKETISRFNQIKVKVLGTVLNNVRLDYSYNRYGYGYYARHVSSKNHKGKRHTRTALLPTFQQENDSAKPDDT